MPARSCVLLQEKPSWQGSAGMYKFVLLSGCWLVTCSCAVIFKHDPVMQLPITKGCEQAHLHAVSAGSTVCVACTLHNDKSFGRCNAADTKHVQPATVISALTEVMHNGYAQQGPYCSGTVASGLTSGDPAFHCSQSFRALSS